MVETYKSSLVTGRLKLVKSMGVHNNDGIVNYMDRIDSVLNDKFNIRHFTYEFAAWKVRVILDLFKKGFSHEDAAAYIYSAYIKKAKSDRLFRLSLHNEDLYSPG